MPIYSEVPGRDYEESLRSLGGVLDGCASSQARDSAFVLPGGFG